MGEPLASCKHVVAAVRRSRIPCRTVWGSAGFAEEAHIVGLLQDEGFRLLSAAEVESTVNEFRPWGRFPVSLFVVLFGDTDACRGGTRRNSADRSGPRHLASEPASRSVLEGR
ncbi:hypothetical protein Q5425_11150 [Amycolatopsis sp. A133]|uniref:hypothetical protein n=1 Tax=Amycolatopsis sp. A133 TaxID=3064472 RepID=UPI0027F3E9B8|nr:hypothetical protein [Amycolatopsis sp. A133]MDQ7804293.1 hypothetical protein [Amycolatopsis sp. A133]